MSLLAHEIARATPRRRLRWRKDVAIADGLIVTGIAMALLGWWL